jgi:hypothetical protein
MEIRVWFEDMRELGREEIMGSEEMDWMKWVWDLRL